MKLHHLNVNGEIVHQRHQYTNIIQTDNNDFYIRPDLDESSDISTFLQYPCYDFSQVVNLQNYLIEAVSNISTAVATQLLQRLINSFQDGQHKTNSMILFNIVHLLRNSEIFDSVFSEYYITITSSYLCQNVPNECILQALYLLEIIVNKTYIKIPLEKICFLKDLLLDSSFEIDYKLIIIRILLKQISLDFPMELSLNLVEILQKLLNETEDLSLQVQSLKFISAIVDKHSFPFTHCQVELFYQYANTKHLETVLAALMVFASYTKNQSAIPQLLKFNLLEKLLHIPLFSFPTITCQVLRICSIMIENNDTVGHHFLTLINLSDFFSSQYPTQVTVLHIIYNLSKKEIIKSLSQISPWCIEFVSNFIESDNEQLLYYTLSIFYQFRNELPESMDKQCIEAIEAAQYHINERIAQIARLFIANRS